jgi:hypothetical protein
VSGSAKSERNGSHGSADPKASRAVSRQRHQGLDSTRSTGIARALKAAPIRLDSSRPASVRLR